MCLPSRTRFFSWGLLAFIQMYACASIPGPLFSNPKIPIVWAMLIWTQCIWNASLNHTPYVESQRLHFSNRNGIHSSLHRYSSLCPILTQFKPSVNIPLSQNVWESGAGTHRSTSALIIDTSSLVMLTARARSKRPRFTTTMFPDQRCAIPVSIA